MVQQRLLSNNVWEINMNKKQELPVALRSSEYSAPRPEWLLQECDTARILKIGKEVAPCFLRNHRGFRWAQVVELWSAHHLKQVQSL